MASQKFDNMEEYADFVWNWGKLHKPYYPKLSKNVLKSCEGCAQRQKYMVTDGFGRDAGPKSEGITNSEMLNNAGTECMLGYGVRQSYDGAQQIPLERCPKPRTKRHYYICRDVQQKFKLV